MRREYGKALSTVAFMLALVGIALTVLSTGLMMAFMMDSMVTDLDEGDFEESGMGERGSEYVARTESTVIGALVLQVTDEDNKGWAWIKVTEDGGKVQRLKNVSFPFMGQYALDGSGEIVVTVIPARGEDISELEVVVAVSGPLGLVSALSGITLAGPCCGAWLGSLAAGLIGVYLVSVNRREGSR